MKGRAVLYSAEELAWLHENRDWPRPLLHRIFVMFFDRPDVTADQIKALCTRKGWKTGRDGRLKPGNVPANKGKKMPFNAVSARTQFKKGQRPANSKPLFSERVGKDGYIEMSVPVPNPYTGAPTRFMHKHRYLWEQANGPLPKGQALKCLDGDRTNCDPANWVAIPRAVLPLLVGRHGLIAYDSAPPELKPTVLAAAKLRHAAREASRR